MSRRPRKRWLGLAALLAVLIAVTASIAMATSAGSTLLGGQTLASGQVLISPDGHYELEMQGDGNLVLYLVSNGVVGRSLWSTKTGGNPGAGAVLQSNGNLVVTSTAGATLWSSNTSSAGCTNLDVEDDGNLVLANSAGTVFQSASTNSVLEAGERLTVGQGLFSTNLQYELAMQGDGNLVLYGPTGALFSTATSGSGNDAVLQGDGNLVVYSSAGKPLFATATRMSGSVAELQTDGNFVIYAPGNVAVYSTKTDADRAAGPSRQAVPVFQSCPPAAKTTTTPASAPTPAPAPAGPVVSTPTPTQSPALSHLRVKLKLSWTWDYGRTRLHKLIVRRFPRHAELAIRCRGKGCSGHLQHTDARHLKRLLRALDGHTYRFRDRLLITISERHFKAERVAIQIRYGAKPRVRVP